MTTKKDKPDKQLTVCGINVTLIRKNIKHVHFHVYPPEGEVKVSAPYSLSEKEFYSLVTEKLEWIKKQQQYFRLQPKQIPKLYKEGEYHFFKGKRYKLKIVGHSGRTCIEEGFQTLILYIKPGTSTDRKKFVFDQWYRQQMREKVSALIKKYEWCMGVKVNRFGIKKMKTRWGSCNPVAQRIWLNVELIKMPLVCLEYVLVHEMTHLLEGRHNTRFYTLMSQFMPKWKEYEKMIDNIEY